MKVYNVFLDNKPSSFQYTDKIIIIIIFFWWLGLHLGHSFSLIVLDIPLSQRLKARENLKFWVITWTVLERESSNWEGLPSLLIHLFSLPDLSIVQEGKDLHNNDTDSNNNKKKNCEGFEPLNTRIKTIFVALDIF